jgi:hypothetical protein
MGEAMNTIDPDDVPQEVLAEIAAAWPASYLSSDYGIWSPDMRSYRVEYRDRKPLTETVHILDPKTFDTLTVDGLTHEYVRAYMVRASEPEKITIDADRHTARWFGPVREIRFIMVSDWLAAAKA